MEETLKQETTLKQMMCVTTEIVKNDNYIPLLHCLKEGKFPYESLDFQGLNILHRAAMNNKVSLVSYLIKQGMDLSSKSSMGQTALMIACNYHNNEIAKLLIDNGADTESLDDFGFRYLFLCSALMYASKENNIIMTIYLIHIGTRFQVQDQEGCTVVHWSAYQDNVFLLRLFKRMGLDMYQGDNQRLSPLLRALMSTAYNAIRMLIKENTHKFFFYKIDPKEYKNRPSLKNLLEKEQDKYNYRYNIIMENKSLAVFVNKISEVLFTRYKGQLSLTYTIACIFFGYTAINELEQESLLHNLFLYILAMFSVLINYFIWLKQYSNYPVELSMGQNNFDVNEFKKHDFTKLDKIFYDNKVDITMENRQNFLKMVVCMVENKQFTQLDDIDWNRYCFTCLKWKAPKTKHCRQVNACIPNFNHYSKIFQKSIDDTNHKTYMSILLIQQFLGLLYLYLQFRLVGEREGKFWVLIPESMWQISQVCYFKMFGFLIVWPLLFYNSLNLLVELVCICKNLTRQELLHRQRYAYLFTLRHKSDGQPLYVYTNPFSQGWQANVLKYFQRGLKQ